MMEWKKRFAILGISLGVILCTFFVVIAVGGIFDKPEEVTDPVITEDLLSPVDKATGKINILFLGVDVEGLRTDTIIVASYDLDNDKINMLSIPRDTRMYIGSRYQKINAAHAITQKGKIKGPQGSIEAVSRLTGIPINYYVEFEFTTFRDTIDALGGLDFDVPRNMFYEDPVQNLSINLKKGYQHLDGDKAEQLVRFRSYPEGDIARVQMQQQFIKALAEQKLNASIIKQLPDLFSMVQKNIKTNFTPVDIVKYLPNLHDLSAENITMHQLPGNFNDVDYGASYWVCNMKETKTMIQDVFGYDASNITIHSTDGTSKNKDIKLTAPATEKPAATKKPVVPEKPAATKKPAATSKPHSTTVPKQSASPMPSKAPAVSAAPTLEPTVLPTIKPIKTPVQEGPVKTKPPLQTKPTDLPASNDE